MGKVFGLIAATLATILPTGAQPQQQAPLPARADRSWAFPLKPERDLPEDAALKTLPGSTKKHTQAQVDDLLNPPDWYPDQHPPPPQIVVKDMALHWPAVACHLMSGLVYPESSDLTDLSAGYIVQQMADFRSARGRTRRE